MIRVLHVISGLGMGGAENMLWKLLAYSSQSRIHSQVISLGAGDALRGRIEDTGTKVVQLDPDGLRGVLRMPLQLTAAARAFRPHLIQGWMNHGNIGAWLAQLGCAGRAAVVWNIRQSLERVASEKPGTRFMIRCGALLSRTTSALIFNSAVGRDQHLRYGFWNRSVWVVPNGFDTKKFAPNDAHRATARRQLAIAGEAPVLGMVARYHPMKNHAMFLHVVANICQVKPGTRVILIGTGMDDANSELTGLIRDLGLARNCILLGECNTPELFYPAMDILCLASARAEGFPNVVGEAMACGVICVATDVGDVRRIVGDTGLVVAADDSEAFFSAILQILQMPADARATMRIQARHRILNEYSIERIASIYMDLYEGLVTANE